MGRAKWVNITEEGFQEKKGVERQGGEGAVDHMTQSENKEGDSKWYHFAPYVITNLMISFSKSCANNTWRLHKMAINHYKKPILDYRDDWHSINCKNNININF